MSKWAEVWVMVCMTVVVGVLANVTATGFSLEEAFGLPVLFQLRGPRPAPAQVVVVTVDEGSKTGLRSLIDHDRQYRALHAAITDRLRAAGASVIAFDLVFEKALDPGDDRAFVEAIERAGNVVLCEALKTENVPLANVPPASSARLTPSTSPTSTSSAPPRPSTPPAPSAEVMIEQQVPPLPIFARAAAATAPFPLPKVPVRVSQYWTFKTIGRERPTLPVAAFQVHALSVYDTFLELLRTVAPDLAGELPANRQALLATRALETSMVLLHRRIGSQPQLARRLLDELDHGSGRALPGESRRLLTSLIHLYRGNDSLYLNFYGPPGTFATIAYDRLLGARSEAGAPSLNGKAVFVGLSELSRPEQRDGFFTIYSQPNGIDISGVEIGATALANLIEDNPVRPLPPGYGITLVILWGIGLALICRLLPTVVAGLLVLVGAAGYLVLARQQFSQAALWLPLVTPLALQAPVAFLGAVGWKYFNTHRERQHIRQVFGYFLPNDVVDQLARDQAAIHRGPQEVLGTCLYTDAAQYTGLAESLTPGELSRFMNRYYETVFRPVRDHGGRVSDVVGDAMLALWTASHPDASLRRRACLAALEITRALQGFGIAMNRPLRTRIGLHHGRISLGNIGGIGRYEYRAVGDVVNTTSRIEGLNKYLGTQVLASAEAVDQLDEFATRELGVFVLAGKSQPIVIHELLGAGATVQGAQRDLCTGFAAALAAFRQASWDDAIRLFHECLELAATDGPSQYYLRLCRQYRERPPGDDWDGVIRLEQK